MSKPLGLYARVWDSDLPKQPPPHPAPEVACRTATWDEVPATARKLLEKARAAGWTVTPTYARGTTLGRLPKVVDSVVLRMRRGDERAVACWVDGRFTEAFLSPQLRKVSSAQVNEAVTAA